MTWLLRCSGCVVAFLWMGSISYAQSVSVEVRCPQGSEETTRALLHELGAIGITPRLSTGESSAGLPLLEVECGAAGTLRLRFQSGARVEEVSLPATEDLTTQALRVSEHCRSWIRLAAPQETRSTEPASGEPNPAQPADGTPLTDEVPEGAPAPDAPTPETARPESEETARPESEEALPQPQPAPSQDDPHPQSDSGNSIGAALGIGILFGEGDTPASPGLSGELIFRFHEHWRARAGAATQLQDGTVDVFGEVLQTHTLRVSGDLSYLLEFANRRFELAFGLGAAALMVKVRGTSSTLSMPPQESSTWVAWPYGLVGLAFAVHPRFRVYAEARGGALSSRVLALTVSDPPPTIVGRSRFEATLGGEFRWGI